MPERETDLVPTSVLTLVLERMKETSDESVIASKEMVKAINEVASAITYPPTRKDLALMLQTAIDVENESNRTITALKKQVEESGGMIQEIKRIHNSIDSLKTTVRIWIGIITVIIALAGVIYTGTQRSVDIQVQSSINKAVETIIKSRPSNKWPVMTTAEHDKLSKEKEESTPHIHEQSGKVRIIPVSPEE